MAAAMALSAVLTVACTYGPPVDRTVAYTARTDQRTREFFVIAHHEVFRPPTGLSTFPDGGSTRPVAHELLVYGADADRRVATLYARQDVPRRLWAALDMMIVGVARDTVYIALSGCPAHSKVCWGPGRARVLRRFTADGASLTVDSVPTRHRPHDASGIPDPGGAYFSLRTIQRDTLTARFSSHDGPARPLFLIRPTGELVPAWRDHSATDPSASTAIP